MPNPQPPTNDPQDRNIQHPTPNLQLWTDPHAPGALLYMEGDLPAPITAARRSELLAELEAGALPNLTFEAVTFRATYPNRNFLRFRDEALPSFAASFAGQPFLRDHDVDHIAARGGTITGSELRGSEFVQRVRLTVPRDIEAFLHGQIDRFSISWFYDRITCSVCGKDWLHSSDCHHWPGNTYPSPSPQRGGAGGGPRPRSAS